LFYSYNFVIPNLLAASKPDSGSYSNLNKVKMLNQDRLLSVLFSMT